MCQAMFRSSRLYCSTPILRRLYIHKYRHKPSVFLSSHDPTQSFRHKALVTKELSHIIGTFRTIIDLNPQPGTHPRRRKPWASFTKSIMILVQGMPISPKTSDYRSDGALIWSDASMITTIPKTACAMFHSITISGPYARLTRSSKSRAFRLSLRYSCSIK